MAEFTGKTERFETILNKVEFVGKDVHTGPILKHAVENKPFIEKTIKDLKVNEKPRKSALVISAGPSLHKFDHLRKLKENGFDGYIICVDASYVKCLRAGIIPDFVLTLDPHPRRMVRWFGDPNFEKNTEGDDFFQRQDLDVDFRDESIRRNFENIEIVNEHASKTKLIIATSAPVNVSERTKDAKFDTYWWNPLVDNPREEGSLTKKLYNINKIPCMNTGGNVGTASWVFATQYLNIDEVGLLGMDLGYHMDTPIEKSQTFYELHEYIDTREELEELFPRVKFPLDGKEYYTDPTYFWYRKNFVNLLKRTKVKTINCSEGGTLIHESLSYSWLTDFIKNQ
jgi:hypothetical protein